MGWVRGPRDARVRVRVDGVEGGRRGSGGCGRGWGEWSGDEGCEAFAVVG